MKEAMTKEQIEEVIEQKVSELEEIVSEFESLINDALNGKYGDYSPEQALDDQEMCLQHKWLIFDTEKMAIIAGMDDLFKPKFEEMQKTINELFHRICNHFRRSL